MGYIKQILNKNRGFVIFYIALGIFNSFLANYKAAYFQRVVDGLAERNILLGSILVYGAVLILNFCSNYLEEYPAKKLENGIFLDFKLLALDKISKIDYLAYQKIGTGKLVQQIENGACAGRNVLYKFWFCLIRQLIPTIIFSIYFIWNINRKITYVLLAGYGIVFVITNILLKSLYQLKAKILNNEEQLNHFLVRGFMEMLVFRMEKQFPSEIRKANGAKQSIVSAKVKMNMIHEAFFTVFALLVAMLDIGILVYAWKSQSISIGSVVALISLIDNAYTPIAVFNVLYVQYKLDKSAFLRFEGFLNLPNDEQLHSGQVVFHLHGDIQIEKLEFYYQERKIFDGLNLSIQKGEKVAFVGESGSGKSTLVKIIAGLLKYNAGNIYLDGKELKGLSLDSLYSQIIYLSQDTPVFDGTIRENLVFDKTVSDEKLYQVLEKVQLLPLIERLQDGLDTKIGERGTSISGGEKQRLALARLWIRQAGIVILDEATSAMDNLTEEHVMHELIDALEHCTVIVIAHRLNALADFDRIIVFRQGEIAGQGTFQELLEQNEYFRELYLAHE